MSLTLCHIFTCWYKVCVPVCFSTFRCKYSNLNLPLFSVCYLGQKHLTKQNTQYLQQSGSVIILDCHIFNMFNTQPPPWATCTIPDSNTICHMSHTMHTDRLIRYTSDTMNSAINNIFQQKTLVIIEDVLSSLMFYMVIMHPCHLLIVQTLLNVNGPPFLC